MDFANIVTDLLRDPQVPYRRTPSTPERALPISDFLWRVVIVVQTFFDALDQYEYDKQTNGQQ